MKRLIIFILVLIFLDQSYSQEDNIKLLRGEVEYISSQFVYVRFNNTEGIKISDTLFTSISNKYIPQLIVESLSSRSCAAKSIGQKLKSGDEVFCKVHIETSNVTPVVISQVSTVNNDQILKVDTTEFKGIRFESPEFRGRFSISGYSNLSNLNGGIDYQNWRYSLSLNAENINNSNFSFSNYISFRYRADEWNHISSNIWAGLKIYDLALAYDFSENTSILFGRKINRKIANLGIIDGLQLETKLNHFRFGGIIGMRPDYSDYSFNPDLLQFGGYINRIDSIGVAEIENTISIFEQKNNQSTDRRFIYIQHSNRNILPNFGMFLSSEIDLYKKIEENTTSEPRFTSLYISLRYTPFRWISTNLSYDARKNVIYYETFKNYADRLIEDALRQGFRLRLNIRPLKFISANIFTGYRYRESDPKSTKNFGGSISHSKLPIINTSASISYLYLNTNYLIGNTWGASISRDFINGIIYGSLGYRNINYLFNYSESNYIENMLQIDLSARLNKNLFFSINYELTFHDKTTYSNIYTNLSVKF